MGFRKKAKRLPFEENSHSMELYPVKIKKIKIKSCIQTNNISLLNALLIWFEKFQGVDGAKRCRM